MVPGMALMKRTVIKREYISKFVSVVKWRIKFASYIDAQVTRNAITQCTRISSSIACDRIVEPNAYSILGYQPTSQDITLCFTILSNIIDYLRVAYCILENHDRKLTFELRLFFGVIFGFLK